MQTETAKALIEAIANGLAIAIDNRNKLIAFEKLLEDHRPDLFQEYQDLLSKVRRNPPTEISVLGFERLQQLLVRD